MALARRIHASLIAFATENGSNIQALQQRCAMLSASCSIETPALRGARWTG
jgi:hypothetical protein